MSGYCHILRCFVKDFDKKFIAVETCLPNKTKSSCLCDVLSKRNVIISICRCNFTKYGVKVYYIVKYGKLSTVKKVEFW